MTDAGRLTCMPSPPTAISGCGRTIVILIGILPL
jgi:hypothetical protein